MAMFQAFDSRVEVLGQSFLAVIEAIKEWPRMQASIRGIYHAYGIEAIDPQRWYPQTLVLDTFRDIAVTLGTGTLYKIGKQIPNIAAFPPEAGIATVEQALHAIDTAYRMNHRGGNIGSYHVNYAGGNQLAMVCHNPYPCDFDQGLIDAMARRFAPPGAIVTISHQPERPCRKAGQDSCRYLVRWRTRH